MSDLLPILRAHTGLPLRHDDVLVLRNVGGLALVPGTPDDHVTRRGFNLLLLDPAGTPSHYVKCRPAGLARARREAAILLALGAEPTLAAHVPRASRIEAERVQALVMDYRPGTELLHALGRCDWPARLSRLRQVLDLAEAAAAVVDRAGLAAAATVTSDTVGELVAEISPGLDEPVSAKLGDAVARAIALPPRLQHGDLTAKNVRVSAGKLLLLDFEAFGEIRVPLADAWNLVRNLPRTGRWAFAESRWWKGPGHVLIEERAAALGLSAEDVQASLVFYLAVTAVTLQRRGVPAGYVRPYLRDLQAALCGN